MGDDEGVGGLHLELVHGLDVRLDTLGAHPAPLHDDIGGVVVPLHVHFLVLVVPGNEVRDVEVLRVLDLLLERVPVSPRRGCRRQGGECRNGQRRDTERCSSEQSSAGEIGHVCLL